MNAEFRIRRNPDFWSRWEDRPVVLTMWIEYGVTIDAVTRNLFKHNDDAVEIRWNKLGLSQGHYVSR